MKPCGPCSPGKNELPCSLDRYELQEMIGHGMATVYRGWDPVLTCKVAVKTIDLPPEGEAEEELARFKREAQAAGRLNHPNIVRTFNFAEAARVAYIVMEFVEGRSLAAALRARERLASRDALRVMDDVLTALQYSHDNGVIHRDIKPANIIVTPDGHAKVADFGIARIQSGNPMRDLTRVGTLIGTKGYMSPEQAEAQTLDARTDIYSTGLVLYQLLTGERPKEPEGGGDEGLIERKALDKRIQGRHRHSKLSPATSRRLAAVIERAAALRVQDRYPSAEEFRQALLEAAVQPRPVPALVASAVASLALAAGVGLWSWWPVPPPRPDIDKLRGAVASIPCALVSGGVAEGGTRVVLNGVATGEAEVRLRATVAGAAPRAPVDWHVATFEGPYCGVLDLLRSISVAFGTSGTGLVISLNGNRTDLLDGDPVVVHITAPNYPSVVQLDYLQNDGTVYHMQSSSFDPQERYAPLSVHSSGEPGPGTIAPLTVLPPFGTDMIIAIASDRPLFPQARPPVAKMQDYLRDLEGAVSAARQRGEHLSGAALVLTTRPSP